MHVKMSKPVARPSLAEETCFAVSFIENSAVKEKSQSPETIPQNADQWLKDSADVPDFVNESDGKTPIEALMMINPKFGEMPDVVKAMAGLLAGIGIDFKIPFPLWAKAASKKFWEGSGMNFNEGMNTWSVKDLSKLMGVYELANNGKLPLIDKYAKPYSDFLKKKAAFSSPQISKQFADGRADAEKVIEKVKFLAQRSKVYGAIAINWHVVEKFGSAAELHKWLLKNNAILPATDSAETRKVCRAIGLKFKSKAGRPRK